MTIHFRRRLLAGAASLCISLPVWAEPTKDLTDEVIVTGTKISGDFGEKSGIPLAKVPQSVQVLTAEELTDAGVRSVGDALRAVPSASVGNSRVARYQSFSLRVRGFQADQMRNGIRQRYYEDVDPSALSNVERIEVLKGPSAVLYGHSAVGGIISMVTKRPQEKLGGSVSVLLGTDDQKLASFDITGALTDTLSARLTGEIERSGTFVDLQDMDRENVGLSLAWKPAERVSAHLVAEYIERRTLNNPGLPVIGTVQPNGVQPLRRGLFLGEPDVGYLDADAPLVQAWAELELGGGWTVTPRLQYQEFNTDFLQTRVRPLLADNVTLTRNGRTGNENDEYYIAQLDLAGAVTTGALTHKLLGGYEFGAERSTFQQFNLTNVGNINVLRPDYTYDSVQPARTFAFDSVGDADTHAIYLQDLIAVTDRFDLVLGARQSWIDYTSVYNGAVDKSSIDGFTWQVGATYRLTDAWSLYGGYNTGFDLENVLGSRSADGTPFDPEESNQKELGIRYAGDGVRFSAALFDIRRTNYLTTDPDNPDFQISNGEARVRGLELEGEVTLLDGWTVQAGAAFMDPEVIRSNDGDEGRLADTPRFQATLNSRIALPVDGLELRLGGSHVGSRSLVNAGPKRLDAYTLVDAGLGYSIGAWDFELTASNLLDKRHFTGTGTALAVYSGDPRQVALRGTVRF